MKNCDFPWVISKIIIIFFTNKCKENDYPFSFRNLPGVIPMLLLKKRMKFWAFV